MPSRKKPEAAGRCRGAQRDHRLPSVGQERDLADTSGDLDAGEGLMMTRRTRRPSRPGSRRWVGDAGSRARARARGRPSPTPEPCTSVRPGRQGLLARADGDPLAQDGHDLLGAGAIALRGGERSRRRGLLRQLGGHEQQAIGERWPFDGERGEPGARGVCARHGHVPAANSATEESSSRGPARHGWPIAVSQGSADEARQQEDLAAVGHARILREPLRVDRAELDGEGRGAGARTVTT